LEIWGSSLTLNWDMDKSALKSITAYRQNYYDLNGDSDATELYSSALFQTERQHQFSEELQLTGKLVGDRLDYAFGLYYFDEGGFIHDYVTFGGGLFQVDGNNLLDTKSPAEAGELVI